MIKLRNIVGGVVSVLGLSLDCYLEISKTNLPPISEHIGDWKYVYLFGGVYPSALGRGIIEYGELSKKDYLVKFGEFLPKFTPLFMTTYMTLGESLLPQLIPGATPDLYDIPAVLLAGLSTYYGVDIITKYGRDNTNSELKT